MSSIMVYLVPTVIGLLSLVGIGFVLKKFWIKTEKGEAFVLTGRGKGRVLFNGGTVFIPFLENLMKVNLKTMRIPIEKSGEFSLNTKDKILVDVVVDFYIRCKTHPDAIKLAAERLGDITNDVKEVRKQQESKFEAVIRSVAESMEHDALFENRTEFETQVMAGTTVLLDKIGFELENVSLKDIKQTPLSFYKDDNVFNRMGKAKVVKRNAEKQKETNAIEQDTKVTIEQKNFEAKERSLDIKRQEEYAELKQEREIATQRNAQEAQIAADEAERKKEAEESRIEAELYIQKAEVEAAESLKQQTIENQRKTQSEQIAAEEKIKQETIANEKQTRSDEIAKEQAVKTAAILRDQAIEVAEQGKLAALAVAQGETEKAEVLKNKAIELAEQEKAIAVADASKQKSESEAAADEARALAVAEQENVITVREVAVADREKKIRLTKAAQEAEVQATEKRVMAVAEKDAAEDEAEAIRITAKAEADRVKLAAAAKKEAELAEVEVLKERLEAEATGKKELHAAENALSDQQIQTKERALLIARMPEIMRELNKPIEKIDSIKIFQTDGIGNSRGGGVPAVAALDKDGKPLPMAPMANKTMMEQLQETLIGYQLQKPMVDAWLKDFGMASTNPQDMVGSLMKPHTHTTPVGETEAVNQGGNGPAARHV